MALLIIVPQHAQKRKKTFKTGAAELAFDITRQR